MSRNRSAAAMKSFALIIFVLMIWALANNQFDVHKTARYIFGMGFLAFSTELQMKDMTTPPSESETKCDLEESCPPDSFAVRLKSGAADVVGPAICFNGHTLISHVRNNVGPGLNFVVANEETGAVDEVGILRSKHGRSEEILNYLRNIELGRIVLLATFDDVTPKLTDEIRDVLESMGSALIKTVKSRDNWVFVGRPKAAEKSPFEKMVAHDEKKNLYQNWPEVVEISGCFPKKKINVT